MEPCICSKRSCAPKGLDWYDVAVPMGTSYWRSKMDDWGDPRCCETNVDKELLGLSAEWTQQEFRKAYRADAIYAATRALGRSLRPTGDASHWCNRWGKADAPAFRRMDFHRVRARGDFVAFTDVFWTWSSSLQVGHPRDVQSACCFGFWKTILLWSGQEWFNALQKVHFLEAMVEISEHFDWIYHHLANKHVKLENHPFLLENHQTNWMLSISMFVSLPDVMRDLPGNWWCIMWPIKTTVSVFRHSSSGFHLRNKERPCSLPTSKLGCFWICLVLQKNRLILAGLSKNHIPEQLQNIPRWKTNVQVGRTWSWRECLTPVIFQVAGRFVG